jgi:CarD family transcriptional regulator
MNKTVLEKYKTGQFVYMPRYGIARIDGIEKEKIAGMDIDMFVLRFTSPNLVFSAQANERTVKKVPVMKADTSFFPLPTKKEFARIVAMATSDAQTTPGRWKDTQDKFEDALKSGDFKRIASVFRKTKMEMELGDRPSYSKQVFYDESLKTLVGAYAHVMETAYSSAYDIFVKKPEPKIVIDIIDPAETFVAQTAIETKTFKPQTAQFKMRDNTERVRTTSSSPNWDMPVGIAVKIKDAFTAESQKLISDKLSCKTLSQLFSLTQGDWPLHAPSTCGIDKAAASEIQESTRLLVTNLQKNIA